MSPRWREHAPALYIHSRTPPRYRTRRTRTPPRYPCHGRNCGWCLRSRTRASASHAPGAARRFAHSIRARLLCATRLDVFVTPEEAMPAASAEKALKEFEAKMRWLSRRHAHHVRREELPRERRVALAGDSGASSAAPFEFVSFIQRPLQARRAGTPASSDAPFSCTTRETPQQTRRSYAKLPLKKAAAMLRMYVQRRRTPQSSKA